MNSELYEKWIKSHQLQTEDIDVADAVMNQIIEQVHRPGFLKRSWEIILLDLIQVKMWVRACVLVSGALIGLFRMFVQIYTVLFT